MTTKIELPAVPQKVKKLIWDAKKDYLEIEYYEDYRKDMLLHNKKQKGGKTKNGK